MTGGPNHRRKIARSILEGRGGGIVMVMPGNFFSRGLGWQKWAPEAGGWRLRTWGRLGVTLLPSRLAMYNYSSCVYLDNMLATQTEQPTPNH